MIICKIWDGVWSRLNGFPMLHAVLPPPAPLCWTMSQFCHSYSITRTKVVIYWNQSWEFVWLSLSFQNSLQRNSYLYECHCLLPGSGFRGINLQISILQYMSYCYYQSQFRFSRYIIYLILFLGSIYLLYSPPFLSLSNFWQALSFRDKSQNTQKWTKLQARKTINIQAEYSALTVFFFPVFVQIVCERWFYNFLHSTFF